MAGEDKQLGTGTDQGQSGEGTSGTGITGAGIQGGEGQPSGTQIQGTTQVGTGGEGGEVFFDPKDIQDKPELMAAYKQMQRSYSTKMNALRDSRQKIEAYDAFMTDPMGQMTQMAQRMGYQIVPSGQQAQAQTGTPWEPQNWGDVIAKTKQEAKAEFTRDLQPILMELHNLRKSNLENFLDENVPDWRQHEDEMMENLKKHPTMVNDPIKLYQISVPSEILESKAVQQAIKKMEEKGKSALMSGISTTTKQPQAISVDKPLSFDDAVKAAKAKLAEEGIKPGT